MTATRLLHSPQRRHLLLVLWILLASIYTIAFSAAIETGDSHRLFDAVSSLVDYGDQYIDFAAWQFPPQQLTTANALATGQLPLETANIEPVQVFAAAPLYWLAKQVPGIGLVHTTYLFNVFVGATVGSVLFLYALALGYQERTAALATIMFGLGTAVFPYTKTFFREPLLMLCLLLSGLALERVRASGYRSWFWYVVSLLALLALALTKASGLLALPALLVVAVPSLHKIDRRLVIALGFAVLLLAAVFVALGLLDIVPGLSARYDVIRRLAEASSRYLGVALHSYLFSIGGSFWGTSPVLLLAIPGTWMLLRERQWRYPVAIVLLVLAFALGYAVLNGDHWFGGLSWPPRFLIPVLPFVLLGALPALDWLARHPRSLWGIASLLLFAYSLWIQITGVSLAWGDYAQALPPEAGSFLEWGGGLNQVEYLRWVVIPRLWGYRPLDNAWALVNTPLIPWLFGALALACALWVWRSLRAASTSPSSMKRAWRFAAAYLPAVLVAVYILMAWVGLRLLFERDGRYFAADRSLREMLNVIDASSTGGDLLLLGSPRYEAFFLNYYKPFDSARIIVLPLQPGEQPSPEQQPLVRSDYPDALLTSDTAPLIHRLADMRERLWLLVQFGPDHPWSTRPAERFMSAHYYPVSYQQTAPETRLIEYLTVSAPDSFAFRGAERAADLVYGDSMRLDGFTLPSGTQFAPGETLPVSLYWRTDAPLDAIYTVAVYLSQPGSLPVAQSDWQPAGNFAPTHTWQVDVPVWDNRALDLPPDLAPGIYQLWVKVYDNPGGSAPRDLPVTGSTTLGGVIGVLPVEVNVSSK